MDGALDQAISNRRIGGEVCNFLAPFLLYVASQTYFSVSSFDLCSSILSLINRLKIKRRTVWARIGGVALASRFAPVRNRIPIGFKFKFHFCNERNELTRAKS